MAAAIDASAIIPPEIPQKRTYEVFSPFEFQAPSGDYYGANVVTAGGPSCLEYSVIFDLRQSGAPSTSIPASANLLGYRNVLRTQAGLMFAASHANSGVYVVEAYEGTPSGATAALNAAAAYVAAGYGNSDEIKKTSVSGGYNAVRVSASWIQKRLSEAKSLGLNPRHDIVLQLGCNSYPANLAFVNVNGLTRNYAGLNDLCPIGTDPTYYHQISSTIFNTMAGVKADNVGVYSNAKFITGVGIAQGLFGSTVFPPNLRSQKDLAMPIADLMRLYNAPRVVLEEVRQDTNRDGGYATQLYYYNPYPTYPYGSGTQDYPGATSVSGQLSASSAPLRVSLRFSEPMDSGWGSFVVRLRFSDNSTQNISGTWSSTVLSNDSWTGTISPSPFPDGQVTVEVRARKALCGSGLDTNNQELDTTGSGNSTASTYQTSASFAIDTVQPSLPITTPNNEPISTSATTNECMVIRPKDPVSGICKLVITGPPGFGSSTRTYTSTGTLSIGSYCQVSVGSYTFTTTNCAGLTRTQTLQYISTTTPRLKIAGTYLGTPHIGYATPTAGEIIDSQLLVAVRSDSSASFGVCDKMVTSYEGNCRNTINGWISEIVVDPVNFEFTLTNPSTGPLASGLSIEATIFKSGVLVGGSLGFGFSAGNPFPSGGSIDNAKITIAQVNQRYPITNDVFTARPPFSWTTVLKNTAQCLLNLDLGGRQVLKQVTSCFDFHASEGDFIDGTPIQLSFSTASASTTTARIYRFSDGAWSTTTVTSQAVTVTGSTATITGTVYRTGLFSVFDIGTDTTAPSTALSFQGSSSTFDGGLFVSTDAYAVLTATDPAVNGYASGAATSVYRMDPTSPSTPYTAYVSSLPLALGTHVFEYYSYDWAGNTETVRTTTFTVTAGTAFRTPNTAQVPGVLLNGFLGSGAKLEIESQAQNALTLIISSVNRQAMLTVDNIGEVGIGVTPQANLNLGANPIALQLRSGNSTSAVTSNQIAFGYNGDYSMRHLLRTEHSTSTDGNKMDFLVWNTGAGSTTTLASLKVLSLQGISTASGGSFHVRPIGVPTAEVQVSNGLSPGGGRMQCFDVVGFSSRRFKTDIKELSEKDEDRALTDVAGLKHANFRYKTWKRDGRIVEDSEQLLRSGLIYEESPESIRDGANALSSTERLVNVEMALKAAIRRLEGLQKRYQTLKSRRNP